MLRCDVWEDLRRSGGGENPIVIPLGLMLLGLCFVALIFHRMKQSNIVACIMIGMVAGGTGLGDTVSRELTAAFIELGIILVLFMGGLEVDVPGFMKRWKLVLLNGLGQIIITLIFFCILGYVGGITHHAADTTFFGLACTLSSTILVLGALKDRNEAETVHGQVILGLMVLQDVVAVVSLLILSSFDPHKGHGTSFGVQIGMMTAKFAATLAILFLLARYVLAWWFKLFAVSGEMLFIGTVGYALGVAGVAGYFDFSPEMGGFFAGVSLSSVPYRLEIEHKVEPIKAFGVVLFFFMLGIDLDMDGDALQAALPWATVLALLTVFVLPALMWALGYLSGFKSRTAFMMGLIINQISEFSLILSQLAHKYEVFSPFQFQVITFATVITLLFSSIGHVRGDEFYEKCKWMLAPLDRRATEEDEDAHEFEYEDHVVLLGFNETSLEIADFYRANNQDVLVVQDDPALHATFKKGYVPLMKRPLIAPGEDATRVSLDSSFNLQGWNFSFRSVEGDGWSASRPTSPRRPARAFDPERDGPLLKGASGSPSGASNSPLDAPSTDSRPLLLDGPADQISSRLSADGHVGPTLPRGNSEGRRSMSAAVRAAAMSPVMESVPAVNKVAPIITTRRKSVNTSWAPGFMLPLGFPAPQEPVALPGAWLEQGVLEAEICTEAGAPEAEAGAAGGQGGQGGQGSFGAKKFSRRAERDGAEGAPDNSHYRSSRETVRRSRSMQQSLRDAIKPARGSRHGTGTNIFSVYADPRSPDSWEHYHLSKAKIVFSAMKGIEADRPLARMLKKEGVPFICITNADSEAKELYEHGCRYVIQQEFLAAKVMKEILDDEIPKGRTTAFDDKRREHKGELHDNFEDDLVREIHHLLS